MPTEISVHDNFLLSYTVEAAEKRITLRTAFYDREPYEFTDVVFTGVCAYHFEGDDFHTILFDITEITLSHLYTDYKDLFERRKNYGWPPIDYKTVEELLRKLTEQHIRGFLIASSCGMDGLILAQNKEVISRETPVG